jgi:hypothetical protein
MSGDDFADRDPGAHVPSDADDGAAHAAGDASQSTSAGAEPVDDPTAASGVPDVDAPVCDLCGARMIERHCRIVCPQCGYTRDCSDP